MKDLPNAFKKFVLPSRRFVGRTREAAYQRALKWHKKNTDVQILVTHFQPRSALPSEEKRSINKYMYQLRVTYARVKGRTRITFTGTEKEVTEAINSRLLPRLSPGDIIGEGVVVRPFNIRIPFVYDVFLREGVVTEDLLAAVA